MLTSNSNSDCLFCSIIDRKEDAIILWETDHFISFMDKYPINPGHVLVLPKNHYEFLTDMNDDDVGLLFQNVSKIAKSMKNTIGNARETGEKRAMKSKAFQAFPFCPISGIF